MLTALIFSILLSLPSRKSNSLICCCCSVAQSCPFLCDSMESSTPGLPVPHHFPKFAQFMSIGSVMPSSHLILWRPLLLSVFPCVRDFSSESAVLIRWPKYWSFNFSFPDSSVGKESACNAGDPCLIPGLARSAGEGIGYSLRYFWASLVAQLGNNLPAVWRPRFYPWVGKIPRRRERLPTPVFWPGEFHGLYHPWGSQRVRHDWATFTMLSFSVGLSNKYSGLISLKIGWFDLLMVQVTFRSLLQHQSSKASILWLSALFTAVSHRLLQYYIFRLVYFLKECFSNCLVPCLAKKKKKKSHTFILNLESSLASFKSLFLRFFSVFSLEEIRAEHILCKKYSYVPPTVSGDLIH